MERILVIDDAAASQTLLRTTLEKEGWRVDIARTGIEGVAMARRARYDAILVDFILPDEDGLAVLRQLAESGVTAPCVIVSGAANPEIAARALRAGALDFLAKDQLTPVRLAHAVRHALTVGPRAIVRVEPSRASSYELGARPPRESTGIALLVDDTQTTRLLLRKMLERNGWGVVEAVNAAQAVDVAIAAEPDIVILDQVLPDRDGNEIVVAFAAMKIPVIALSGHGDDLLARQFIEAGASEFLGKQGLTEEALLTTLSRVLWVRAAKAAVEKGRN